MDENKKEDKEELIKKLDKNRKENKEELMKTMAESEKEIGEQIKQNEEIICTHTASTLQPSRHRDIETSRHI